MIQETIVINYINALKHKYEAQILEAEANLSLYFSGKLAAIGEHSSLMEEHDKWLDIYATAKGKLEVLEQKYISKINNKV